MKDQDHNPESTECDQLDQLLDASLAQYSQSEPLTGLEDRILARLEGTAAEPTPWWGAFFWQRWGWAVTAMVLVAGITAGMFFVTSPGDDIDYVGEGTAIEIKAGAPVETLTAALPPRIPPEVFRAAMPKVAAQLPNIAMLTEGPGGAGRGVQSEVRSEVRNEVFPAPAPLSEQERLALAYARIGERLPLASAIAPERGIRELEVPRLQLTPLKVEELEKPATDVRTNSNTSK